LENPPLGLKIEWHTVPLSTLYHKMFLHSMHFHAREELLDMCTILDRQICAKETYFPPASGRKIPYVYDTGKWAKMQEKK
jgi:hypothetical protein